MWRFPQPGDGMSGIPWTRLEDEILRDLYPSNTAEDVARVIGRSTRAVWRRAGLLGLKKSREWIAETARERNSRPGHGGQAHRFVTGLVPWNKGKPFAAGGRSVETQFKPGSRPRNWQPVGHERITKEGYLQRKMADTGVTRRDYVNVHWLVWRAAGRDIPPGHAIVFRDGNTRNFDLDNLELITRAELMRRNSYHNYGVEIARVVQLRGAITRQINRKHHQEESA